MNYGLNMNQIPKISVIMPVYNSMPFLPMAIESILRQDFSDFEFIIVINGINTDGSPECALQYAKQDARIKVIVESQKGIIYALNTAIYHAQGEYIARMDGDDISLPQRLRWQYNFMQNHSEVGFIGTQFQYIDENGTITANKKPKPTKIQGNITRRSCPILHPSLMVRGELMRKTPYRPIPCEDNDLFYRLSELANFANLNEIGVYYRRHSNQITAQPNKTNIYYDIYAFLSHLRRNQGLTDFFNPDDFPLNLPKLWRFCRLPQDYFLVGKLYLKSG